MFHVELRKFPHQARAFNLSRQELEAKVLRAWVGGRPVELDDHRWAPDKSRLTIYEGPELTPDQLGLGRGWANVTRQGEDVTARLLAEVAHPPPVAALKRELLDLCAAAAVPLGRLVELAGEWYPQSRVSERMALCEAAVWELVHEGRVALARGGAYVEREDWQAVLLGWESWREAAVTVVRV